MAPTLPYRDINVKVAPDSYIFTSPSSPDAPALVIDRPTGDLRLGDAGLGKRVSRVSSIAGILGIIQLRLDKYVIVITKAQPVGRLKGHMVYKVLSTEILPMRERQIRDPDEDTFIGLLDTFMKNGPMYFSYSFDLTNSFQRQASADTSLPLWQRADDRFFFNRFIQSDLIDFRTRGARGHVGPQTGADPFILPVIFGMLEIKPTTFKGTPVTITLISRRSRHRGGTRYFTRGVDDEGHAANYNETEQITIFNDSGSGMGGFAGSSDMQSGQYGNSGKDTQIMSYVQTRGSVPTYWAEINSLRYVPKLQVRSIDSALPAAKAHFEEQIRLYGDNYLINLVNQKGREQRVKNSYEQMVEKLISSPKERTEGDRYTDEKFTTIQPEKRAVEFDRLHYIYFDYHHETKGMKMHRAYALIERLKEAIDAQGYFRAVDMPGADGRLEPRSYQTSVMRTNCMDCLDRTNVVQSMFARHMLDRIFEEMGLMTRGSSFRDEDPSFEHLFRNLWADNADVVSCSYSGTGAMKTDVTRTGVRTKQGALQDARIGVTRYFKNNFFDGPRQDSYDLFLGTYHPGTANIGSSLIFADRRPILIQAVPYLLAFGIFLVLVGLFSKTEAVVTIRLFILFWLAVSVWSASFVFSHGMLYVNWPKLNPRPWANEGYNEHMTKASKDSVLGSFVARHERGLSTARFLNAEEGKKRIE
ncbi:Phosphoinositide phosphatase SAC1 [Colletotrichum orbiculare MAFF 240422]|uniref:Phosphoinositide phosphatase SAC1 n=1 Tax=Colletotrichum orbiculare (strain 104-T / ATCC 96160 / CBS 514.97 / LARS 414 / MAFF 240422) TaxID=1213857 RepID=N4VKU5_COLOR|nr:Phosphoinositide phosphatase SAC1 [Colletotrichum orbiculare MAFF 240422]